MLNPLRRRADGSFEEIDWATAITEVAGRLAAVRDTYGGESILYYGGEHVEFGDGHGVVSFLLDLCDSAVHEQRPEPCASGERRRIDWSEQRQGGAHGEEDV